MNDKISQIINEIKGNGDFVTKGALPFILPGLKIEEVGDVSFPVSKAESQQIIKAAQQAGYGKGLETIVDTSVRNVWEIDASKIRFCNPEWSTHLNKIKNQIATGLGAPDEKIEMNLYKLLIYEEGSFFLSHKDSEKEQGMIATAVVNLPSKHSGGELQVRFSGKEEKIDFSDQSNLYQIAYAAFYTDCEHEIKPVKVGYRVCLIYNLVQNVNEEKLVLHSFDKQVDELVSLLKANVSNFENTPKAFVLEHEYTEANFSLNNLKGHDKSRTVTLLEAAERAGYFACPALLTKYLEGDGEYEYGSYRYGEVGECEMGEIFEEELYVTIDGIGKMPSLGKVFLNEKDVITLIKLDEGTPSEEENGGFTGNAGVTLEYWYHHGAIVFWPKALMVDLIIKSDNDVKLAWIEFYAKNILAHKNQLKRLILSLRPPSSWGDNSEFELLIKALIKMPDETLIKEIYPLLVAVLSPVNTQLWIEFLTILTVDTQKTFFENIFEEKNIEQLSMYLSIINGLKESEKKGNRELLQAELNVLPLRLKEYDLYNANNKKEAKLIVSELIKLGEFASASFLEEVYEILKSSNKRSYVNNVLAEVLRNESTKKTQLGATLRTYCIGEIKIRVANKPVYPSNWKKYVPSKSSNKSKWDLIRSFLESETQTVFEYKARQNLRSALENMIRNASVDVVMKTISKGSPHVLKLTKTHASYERAFKNWKADCVLFRELNE